VQDLVITARVVRYRRERWLTPGGETIVAPLRAGAEIADWVTVDDTGARHCRANAVCTQIGNDRFAGFGTTGSKSQLNSLDLLRAGHTDCVINDAALDYMRQHALAGPVVQQLAAHPQQRFADLTAWTRHLEQLGVAGLLVTPDPARIATEGALWRAVRSLGFLSEAVVVSDLRRHAARCPAACPRADLVVLCRPEGWLDPTPRRRWELRARFDRIFQRHTGFATLDRLLQRLHANKAELLMVLDRPEIPLHTNGPESDIRCQVTKRQLSGGTRTDTGRDCRDAFLGLAKT